MYYIMQYANEFKAYDDCIHDMRTKIQILRVQVKGLQGRKQAAEQGTGRYDSTMQGKICSRIALKLKQIQDLELMSTEYTKLRSAASKNKTKMSQRTPMN